MAAMEADDVVLVAAEQVFVIEEVRAYCEGITVIDMNNAGQLAGHLMKAEVLLARVNAAFAKPVDA